jgi:metal-sulfur cluster biosynthetic enzyme
MAKKGIKKQVFNEEHPYYEIINKIIDPDLGIGLADMGLIYSIKEKDGSVLVTMTLTSMGCPFGPDLISGVSEVLSKEKGIKDVQVEVVWDPPWIPDMMKKELREMLFGG